MDFHKLMFKFCKSCNEIGQKHFGSYLKNKVFLIQSLGKQYGQTIHALDDLCVIYDIAS